MKIAVLTQWCDPEPTPKGLTFASKLVELGHDVEVITGFPNYPGGQIYAGYKMRWRQREKIDGVNITRLPLYPSHDESSTKRVLNYLSFMVSSTIYGIFMMRKPDVLYVYHPPATVGVAGSVISLIRRVPFVYDIQDLWPDTLAATGMVNNPGVLRVIGSVCRWIYRRASHIVVLSKGFREELVARGVASGRVSVIPNWCNEATILQSEPRDGLLPNGFNILFAGNVGLAQSLDAVIDAASIVSNDPAHINVAILGSGVDIDRLKRRVANLGIDNVVFLPRVPMTEVGSILLAADVLLVHLRDDDLFRITIPSKTQAYMAIGKPLLMGVRGNAATLVRDARAGIECQPEDPSSIASAFRELASMSHDEIVDLGRNARDYYFEHLSLAKGTAKFVAIFNSVGKAG